MGGKMELIQGKQQAIDEYESKQCDLKSEQVAVTRESTQTFFDNLKWLTSREATEYLRLPSVGALRQLVYRRRIPFSKMGRSLRFNRHELDRFLESSAYPKRRSG